MMKASAPDAGFSFPISGLMKRFFISILLASTAFNGLAPALRAQVKPPEHVTLVSPDDKQQPATRNQRSSGPLLPEVFAGWKQVSGQSSKDPAQADPTNVALLKEYGFTDEEHATYQRAGSKMEVKAARFADAGGAYGAFTSYKEPDALKEDIGDQGASLAGSTVLFYRGNVLVQARLQEITAMTAAGLRELSDNLPLPAGQAANLPLLPSYLPKEGYVKNTAKYVVGPVGYEKIGAPLSPQLIDFSRGAEVVLGKYTLSATAADLLMISYPTPQIAAERLHAIEAASNQPSTPTYARRSGPIVIVAAGQISSRDARALIGSVNYDASVTWNEATSLSKRDNIGNLIVAAFMLIGILLLFGLAVGVAFGGVRLLMRRLFPNRVAQHLEIIRLKISD